MKEFFNPTDNHSLSPIMIKNNGKIYWTLYDVLGTDSLLHNEKNILYFLTQKDMDLFCEKNSFETDKDIWEYDFDAPLQNPIHYGHILDHWNLLNTIAKDLRMYFEGDLLLSDSEPGKENYSSGGFISDSVINKTINSGSQQQWLIRNSIFSKWNHSNMNMVFMFMILHHYFYLKIKLLFQR